jgi:adenylate kinase
MKTKNIIIASVPGAGKTHVLEFSILYSILRGHFIIPITILADCALAIGSIHFHKLLKYNKSYGSAQHLAEKALVKIVEVL